MHDLRRKLNYLQRFIGTALGFVSFGLGGLLFAAFIVPFIWLSTRDAQARGRKLRGAISRAFRWHINLLAVLGVLQYQVYHGERLTAGQLVIANHPTLLDIVFLVGFVENAVCVVKEALFHNVYLGFVIRTANYISNKDPEILIDASIEALKRGESVIIFPEGTRSVPGQSSQLQRGAAYIALRAQIGLTPVQISCVPSSLTKAEPWYQIPASKMQFEFIVGEEINAAGLAEQQRSLAARHMNKRITHALFETAEFDSPNLEKLHVSH